MRPHDAPSDLTAFTRRALIVTLLGGLAAALAVALWFASDFFLLLFGGVLFAVFLHGLADLVHRVARLPRGVSLALTCLILAALVAVGGWFLVDRLGTQFDAFAAQLQRSWQQMEHYLRQSPWGRQLLHTSVIDDVVSRRVELLGRLAGWFSSALGTLTNLFLLLFLGIYLAAAPETYRTGVLRLVPMSWRGRAGEVLDALGTTLRHWMLGRVLNMTIIGLLSALGLWLLDVPLVVPLSLLAFALDFVPYLGPIIASIPAVLIALTVEGGGPERGLYVALLYIAIHNTEGYLLLPLIQRRAVEMPPALIIAAQVLLGLLAGVPGLTFATPMAATAFVLVKMLYVEDTLGDRERTPSVNERG